MAKQQKRYICSSCDAVYIKWQGKCNTCEQWNTIIEESIFTDVKTKSISHEYLTEKENLPKKLDEINTTDDERIDTHDGEFNRVLGGGLVKGGVVLVSGEPGIGKSTLLLQLFLNIKLKTLYVSGEESLRQIKRRAERLNEKGVTSDGLLINEVDVSKLIKKFQTIKPDIIIIDSIQTLFSPLVDSVAGSIGQIRQSMNELIQYAKHFSVPLIIIGHITKDGGIAGPKVLEHIVDTVLHFEGDRQMMYRVLRTVKNRFGSTDELGLYTMTHVGLEQVSNPSEILISKKDQPYSGSSIAVAIEGNRSLLVEIQALATVSSYGTAQRSTIGFDTKRLHMLLAVMEKRMRVQASKHDIFLNLTGGVKLLDPALDLAATVSIFSSFHDIAIDSAFVFCAELGLSGELRPVSRIAQRVIETERLGYKRIYISKYNNLPANIRKRTKIEIKGFSTLQEVLKDVFSK